ncbi:MAG: RNA 2',3'-cyclic phosphodiesterase [Phycisphaeraceae bacterium]|nr:RNA 2',3'-cyclic phosphodiesterase [Phycisphaeraceae bacterium]
MTRPHANQRLFVSIVPPIDAARAWLDLLHTMSLPDGRYTPEAQVHLTVQFIGDVPVRALDDVIESVRRSAAGLESFQLQPRSLRALPQRGPARLVAVETDCPPTLVELKRRLVHRLAAHARREAAERFLPHLTLLRFTPVADLETRSWPMTAPPVPVTAVSLMRSILHPAGARHVTIDRVQLAGSA